MNKIISLVVFAALAFLGWTAAANSGPLVALGLIERGEWQLRAADGATRSICLSDPEVLLQLRHPGSSCQRFVVENAAKAGRITYSCAGIGNGDTRIRVETPRLIRLETQGISKGLPFTEQYEGRRTGACAPSR